MINKKSKGKEHIRRPLPVRAIAILLALAMVLSVVYINNRREVVVKAETPTLGSTVKDDNYLDSVYNEVSGGGLLDKTVSVYVPVKGMEFTIPTKDDNYYYSAAPTGYHVKSDNVYYINEDNAIADGYADESDREAISYYPAYKKTFLGAGAPPTYIESSYDPAWELPAVITTGDSDVVLQLFQTDNDYSLSNTTFDGITFKDSTTKTAKLSGRIVVKTYDPEGFVFDTSGSTVQVTDVATTENDTTKYYGDVTYSYSKDGGTAQEASLDEIKNLFDNTAGAEGSYSITKTIKDNSKTNVLYTKTVTGTVNQGIFATSFTASESGNEVSDIDGDGAITLPASNYVSPLATINVQLAVDNFTSAAITKDGTDVTNDTSVITGKSQTATNLYFTILGNGENVGSVAYVVTLTDDKGNTDPTDDLTKDFTLTVNYYNGKPAISNITVDDKGPQKDASDNDIYYVNNKNSNSASISASATIADPKDASVSVTSASVNGQGCTVSEGTITGSVYGLNKGSNNVTINATSSLGIASDDTTINVFYDPDDPYIVNTDSTKLTVSQMVDSTPTDRTATFDSSTNTYTAEVSANYATTISVPVSDLTSGATPSGIASVKVNGASATISGGVVTIPSAAATDTNGDSVIDKNDDPRLGGNDVSYTIEVADNAGNTKSYTATLDFINEEAKTVAKFNETPIDAINNVYFHWSGDNRTATVTYTVYTNVDLITDTTDKPHIMYTSTATATETRVEVSSTGARTASDDANYKYMYTITYNYPNESMSNYHLKLVVKNVNGYVSEHETEVRSVDITKPQINAPTNADWHQNLELTITVPDDTYSSGIDYVDAEGTTNSKYTEFDTNNSNAFKATVQPSPDASGTTVKFTAYDKAGNKIENTWESTYFVDQTKPETHLTISGVSVTDGTVDDTVANIQTIPTISYAPSDVPSGIDATKTVAQITDGTTTVTLNEAETSLSDYLTVSDDKVYTVTVYVEDLAGNSNTTSKKFKVDGTKPIVKVEIDDPTAPTKGINPYYNKDVKVKLTINDTNIDESKIKIYDNDQSVDVSWSGKETSEWTAYYTVSAAGTHTVKLTAQDTSTNIPTPEYAENTFTIDKTAPTIKTFLDDAEYTSTTAYKAGTATSKMTVTDDYGEDTADERVTITLTTPTGETKTEVKEGKGPFTFNEDGVYTLKYEAIDKAGNPAEKTIGFTVDGAKPVHNIYVSTSAAKTAKFSNTYSNKVGKFTDYSDQEEYTYGQYFNTDVFIDVSYFDYNMETATVYDNGNPISVNWGKKDGYGRGTIAISSEGYHTIWIESIDKSGNVVNDKTDGHSVSFTIDKTSPILITYLNGEGYVDTTAYTSSAAAEVAVTDDNDDAEDITIKVERQIPGGDTVTSTIYGSKTVNLTEDGYYTVTYTSVDRAGNPASASYGFTVDNTSPVHNMYVLVENPSKFSSHKNNYVNPVGVFSSRPSQENYEYGQYYNYNVNVELNVFDYNLDWVYVTDNDVEITPTWTWNGAYGTAVVTLQTEGYHELKLWSKDLSGNETNDTEAGKKIRLYIDKTSPTITTYVNSSLYTEGSGIRYLNTNANVSVSVNDTYKDSSDLVRTVRMTPPGGSTSVTTENVNETTESFATEADYEVTYVATDMAGNQSATRTVQFRVDKTPPQLSIADGGGTSTASSVAVSFNIKEAFYWDMNSVKISIYKKRDGSGEVLEKTMDFTPRSANDSFSYTLTEDAEYRFEFSAEDKCGNKTEVKGQLIKDGTAPIILLSGVSNYDKTDKNVTLNVSVDEAFYTSNKVTLTGTRTDIDGKTTNIDFSQFVTNRTKVSQLEQLFDEDGIYDITITSTDKAGNTSSKSVHFTIDTTDPVIGDLSKYDGVKVNKFSWDIDLDDLVTDLTVCDISVYMDGALYDGTSEISDGSHVLKVEAVDELGHKSFKEVTFVLDTKGPNIIISNVENGDKLLEATDVTVTVELDEDVLDTVSLNDKAVSVSDNKATITVNSKGTYKLTATAHDEAGNTSSTEISFSFGKQANLVLIGVIAGIAILLLLILLVLLRRRRDN